MLSTKGKKIGKKASLFDIVIIAVALTFFSMAVLFGSKIAIEMQSKIADMPIFQNEAPDAISETSRALNNYEGSVNTGFFMLTIFLALITLGLAALVRIHPIFIPFFLLGLIFIIFLCGIFSNIYQTASSSTQLSDIAAQYNMMHLIMSYLPLIVGVFGFLLMIVMYKMWSIQQ